MEEAQNLIERLLAAQNPDGGWPYLRGTSWVEPTAYVVLALQSQQGASTLAKSIDRATAWLLLQQRPSGGWTPNAAVEECTSVTSIATLALMPQASPAFDRALKWTASQVYRDEFSLSLMLSKVFGTPPAHAPGSVAWYPGTAGWVTPTSLSALTLFRAARERHRPDLQVLGEQCCSYLLSRRCADFGWNHGGSKTRSDDARSYPETTGLALLALRAGSIVPPSSSVALAKHFAAAPQSIEGLSWLQLALQSADRPSGNAKGTPVPRTTRDTALRVIALVAARGSNILLNS